MRGFIKFCAGLFVVAGALVVVVSVVLAALMLGTGNAVPGMVGTASLVVIAAGLASGASIVLVGGGTFLLASIDHRLEMAMRGAGALGAKAPPSELAA